MEGDSPTSSATPDREWLVWQLVDSAFPAGAFSHSGGLEAAWKNGALAHPGALRGYLEASLRQCTYSMLPLVRATHREPARFQELDSLCDVWLSNHVANRASRLQGRAFWMAVSRSLLDDSLPAPEPGHLPAVFGFLLERLGVDEKTALRLFLFCQTRGWISAAVRLGLIGPLEAQSIQSGLATLAGNHASLPFDGDVEQSLVQTEPLLDIWQGTHDRIYSRLFQS